MSYIILPDGSVELVERKVSGGNKALITAIVEITGNRQGK